MQVRRWLVDDAGHTAIEYALVASLLSIAAITAFALVGAAVQGMFTSVGANVATAATP